jgi:hypothetical protein
MNFFISDLIAIQSLKWSNISLNNDVISEHLKALFYKTKITIKDSLNKDSIIFVFFFEAKQISFVTLCKFVDKPNQKITEN